MTTPTSTPTHTPSHQLDASGLMCPEPVMMLHGKVRELAAGDILEVIATDPSTTRDIAKFCQFLGHTLLWTAESNGRFLYHIRIEKK